MTPSLTVMPSGRTVISDGSIHMNTSMPSKSHGVVSDDCSRRASVVFPELDPPLMITTRPGMRDHHAGSLRLVRPLLSGRDQRVTVTTSNCVAVGGKPV